MDEVTRILSAIERGDEQAAEQLLPLVYDEPRRLAKPRLAQEKPGQTLQSTELVHEVHLRLYDGKELQRWKSRGHFFVAPAEAMRRILIDGVREKHVGERVCRTTAKRFRTMRRPSPPLPTTARWSSMNLAFSLCWVTNVARAPIKVVW